MLTGPAPIESLTRLMSEHLVPQLADEYNAAVLILLAVIGGFVALMERSGAATHLPSASPARSAVPNPDLRMELWHRHFLL